MGSIDTTTQARRRGSFGYGITSPAQTQSQHVSLHKVLRSLSDIFSGTDRELLSQMEPEESFTSVEYIAMEYLAFDDNFSTQEIRTLLDELNKAIEAQGIHKKETERILLSHLRTAIARYAWESRMGATLSMRRLHGNALKLARILQTRKQLLNIRQSLIRKVANGTDPAFCIGEWKKSMTDTLSDLNGTTSQAPKDAELLLHLDLIVNESYM